MARDEFPESKTTIILVASQGFVISALGAHKISSPQSTTNCGWCGMTMTKGWQLINNHLFPPNQHLNIRIYFSSWWLFFWGELLDTSLTFNQPPTTAVSLSLRAGDPKLTWIADASCGASFAICGCASSSTSNETWSEPGDIESLFSKEGMETVGEDWNQSISNLDTIICQLHLAKGVFIAT